jgi:hypothetical protein
MMIGRFMLAIGLAAVTAPALAAEYYIVQNPTTKECRIVTEKPEPSVGIVVGTPFGARVEAENRMRTVTVCSDQTTGSGTTIIEKK